MTQVPINIKDKELSGAAASASVMECGTMYGYILMVTPMAPHKNTMIAESIGKNSLL